MPKIMLFDTPVDNLTLDETVKLIEKSIDNRVNINHTVINAGKIVAMQNDIQLKKSVTECNLINADGQAIVWASQIFRTPLKERVTGIDLMINLVKLSCKKKYKIFLFGAKQEVVETLVSKYSKLCPDIVAGFRNGYFGKSEEKQIAKQIAESGAHLLFVAISSPIKETFLYENREILKNVYFTMGVGGSFDVESGLVKRAPIWMQNHGLEWLHRVIQEPRRMWKRYLIGNSKFIMMVMQEVYNKKFKNNCNWLKGDFKN